MIVLIVLTVSIIFSSSLKNQEESGEMSGAVVEVIKPIIDSENKIPVDKFEFSVRKAAHFSEFFLLALELCILYTLLFEKSPLSHHIIIIFFVFMLVALTDETIQISSGRGSSVVDVWIDISGGCTACVLYLAGGLLSKFIAKKRKLKTHSKKKIKNIK